MSYFKVVVFPPFCTAALDISVPPPAKFHFNTCIGLQCSSPSHPVSKYQHGLTITWHHKLPGDTTVATSIFYVVLWFNDPTIHDGDLVGKTNIGPAWAKPQKGKIAVGATWASLQGPHGFWSWTASNWGQNGIPLGLLCPHSPTVHPQIAAVDAQGHDCCGCGYSKSVIESKSLWMTHGSFTHLPVLFQRVTKDNCPDGSG